MSPRAGRRTLLIAWAIAAGLLPGDASTATRTLTLDEAIRLAVQKSEGLVIERESVASADEGVQSARGAYDPLLGLDWAWVRSNEPVLGASSPADPIAPENESWGAGVGIEQRLPTGGVVLLHGRGARGTTESPFVRLSPGYSTRAGVELRQPLLRNLAIDESRLAVRVAKADRAGAGASLVRALNQTVAAIELSYWALAAHRLGVLVREEAVRLATEQLAETRERVASGTVAETELAQPRAELERRRADLFATREAVARAENRLKLQILDDADSAAWLGEIVPIDSVPAGVDPVDPAASITLALAQRPELAEAQAVLERRHAEAAFARNAVWPSLDAVVAYDRYGLAGDANPAGPGGPLPPGIDGDMGQSWETLGDGDYDATRVALVLGLPIRNRTARANAAIARNAERQADAELARMRKFIRTEVLDAAAALETAGQRIEATRTGRRAAEIQLSSEQDLYATGLSTNFLVLTRQNDLASARLEEISALTDYRMAHAELARATGTLAAERGIPLGDTTR